MGKIPEIPFTFTLAPSRLSFQITLSSLLFLTTPILDTIHLETSRKKGPS